MNTFWLLGIAGFVVPLPSPPSQDVLPPSQLLGFPATVISQRSLIRDGPRTVSLLPWRPQVSDSQSQMNMKVTENLKNSTCAGTYSELSGLG